MAVTLPTDISDFQVGNPLHFLAEQQVIPLIEEAIQLLEEQGCLSKSGPAKICAYCADAPGGVGTVHCVVGLMLKKRGFDVTRWRGLQVNTWSAPKYLLLDEYMSKEAQSAALELNRLITKLFGVPPLTNCTPPTQMQLSAAVSVTLHYLQKVHDGAGSVAEFVAEAKGTIERLREPAEVDSTDNTPKD